MSTGRPLRAKQVVVIESSAQYKGHLFGIRVGVFRKDARHRLRPARLQCSQPLPVIIQQVADARFVGVVGVADDVLVDQIGIKRPLPPGVGTEPEIGRLLVVQPVQNQPQPFVGFVGVEFGRFGEEL